MAGHLLPSFGSYYISRGKYNSGRLCMAQNRWNYLCMFFCTTLGLLVSCGKSKSGDEATRFIPPITGNENFLDRVNATAFFCDEADCPDYTVAVAVNNLGNLNPTWCTGTVLKNGQVLTARSCFGDYFFDSPNNCKENVLIKTLSGSVLGCDKVLNLSAPAGESAKDPASKISDFVLLGVPLATAKNFPGLENEKGDLKPGSTTAVWHVNHWYDDGLEVALEHKQCFYQEKNLISPWEKPNPHLMLSQCALPLSARGSAIFDKGKQIVGIVHTISKDKDLTIWDHRVLPNEKLDHYALGNTLSCTGLIPSTFDYCDQKNFLDVHLVNLRQEIFTQFNDLEKWTAHVKEYAELEQDKYIRWTAVLRFVNEDLLYEVDFIPQCFQDGRRWLEEFRGGLFNMFYDKSGSVFKEWPFFKIFSGLNSHFVLKTELFDTGELLYESHFSPRDLKKKGKSDLRVINKHTQKVVSELKDVPFCQ